MTDYLGLLRLDGRVALVTGGARGIGRATALALTQAGVSREDAYEIVQRHAMKTWEDGSDFLAGLKSDRQVTSKVPAAQLDEMFDLGYHLKHVDTIFKRVFG